MKVCACFVAVCTTIIAGCSGGDGKNDQTGITNPTTQDYAIELSYEHGNIINKNIYVIWIEDETSGYIKNLRVCERLVNGFPLTDTALPYWKHNKFPKSDPTEVSAVSRATDRNVNFTVTGTLETGAPKTFRVFFETDRSYDGNEWFSNQPALLYSVPVDLDHVEPEYTLDFYGWTPNEGTENIIPSTPEFVLVRILEYITHKKPVPPATGFGDEDTANRATNMVKKITVKFTPI